MSAVELLRDALARVIAISEALDAGDVEEARAIAGGLENDLARAAKAQEARP